MNDDDIEELFNDVKDFDPATTVIDSLSGKSIFAFTLYLS